MSIEPQILPNVVGDYPDYLRDESRKGGCAASISFPRTEAELREQLAWLHARGLPVTVQGARTGITGGAVPDGGHVLSLTRHNRITGLRHDPASGAFALVCQPGVLLKEVREALHARDFDTADWPAEALAALRAFRAAGPQCFPPDLTEVTAAVGGLTACNGSGARSFAYGATRNHVRRARVVLADGDVLELRRGAPRAVGRRFAVTTAGGRTIAGALPAYRMPDVKNAAGYYAADDMDILDLFIGSEGTLGVFAEIELGLTPLPRALWGLTAFLPTEAAALDFVCAAREAPVRPAALEFLDARALDLLRAVRQAGSGGDIPELPAAWHTAVYAECHAGSEAEAEAAVAELAERLAACGGDMDATWLATGEREIERFKAVRHAVPEGVNQRIDQRRKSEPRLTKLGTDLSVPDHRLRDVMALYHAGLDAAGLDFVIFGHIGNNHVHVNIIPRTMDEYQRGKQLYQEWARQVVAWGGSVSAEHGIGKLKVSLLRVMYGTEGIAEMRALKRVLDPEGRLNAGNLFAAG